MGKLRNNRAIPGHILALASALAWSTAATAEDCEGEDGAIDWEVRGRFALFRPASDAKPDEQPEGDKLLEKIADAGGNLVDGSPAGTAEGGTAYKDIIKALVAREGDKNPIYKLTYYDRQAERYSDLEDFLQPKFYEISADLSGAPAGLCTWTVAGVPQSSSCWKALLKIPRDWSGPARAVKVTGKSPAGQVGTACVLVREKLIVGMGESFASGEGNPDQPTGWHLVPAVASARQSAKKSKRLDATWWTKKDGPLANAPATADAQWWDNSCHRSLLSQHSLAALADASRDKRRVTTFLSFACSGATILDGIVAPRVEAPGVTRLAERERSRSPSISKSQINQVVETLCADRPGWGTPLPVPSEAAVWAGLDLPREDLGQPPKTVSVRTCTRWARYPDALLLSIGGNDTGFGGVIYWGIVPPAGRRPLSWIYDPAVAAARDVDQDEQSVKKDFAVVCPDRYIDVRCQESKFTAQTLLGELPHLYRLMDETLSAAGLAAVPVKLHMSYPPISRDEDGELCGELWRWSPERGHQYQLESWMPLYTKVLGKLPFLGLPLAALFRDWTFGLYETLTIEECNQRKAVASVNQEMCIVEREMVRKLNAAVAQHRGWTVMDAGRLPLGHGICAAEPELKAASGRDKWDAFRNSFGWPRWRKGEWIQGWPRPEEWNPYLETRQRWFRTSTDSALTQSVFDGGLRSKGRPRSEDQRQEESNSGTVHPTAHMHAAMAELIAEKLAEAERETAVRTAASRRATVSSSE